VNTEYRQKCLCIIENLRHVIVGEENSWKKKKGEEIFLHYSLSSKCLNYFAEKRNYYRMLTCTKLTIVNKRKPSQAHTTLTNGSWISMSC